MGAAPSAPPGDEVGKYQPPRFPDDNGVSVGPVLAAIRIQKIVRGRRIRRSGGFEGLFGWCGTFAREVQTAAKSAVVGAQGGALSALLKKTDVALQSTYVKTLKPMMTPCPATPSAMRWMVHSLGDRAWSKAHESLVHSLGDVLAERFLPPAECDEERQPVRHVYNFSWAAWRRAPWLARGRMALMFVRAKLLYAYLPYDQTIWLKIGSLDCLLFIILATLPNAQLRAALYSALLVCLTFPWADASAHQFVEFLLIFKGTQFFSGLLLSVYEEVYLWRCAVLANPPTCGDEQDAGSYSVIADQVSSLMLWTLDSHTFCFLRHLSYTPCSLLLKLLIVPTLPMLPTVHTAHTAYTAHTALSTWPASCTA
jgi:hypothetical protein